VVYPAPAQTSALPITREVLGRMCLAIPGQIQEIVDDDLRLARVDVAGVRRNVNIGLLDSTDESVRPGDWVLIHVGFALSKIDEAEAMATHKLLEQMGAEYEQELEELKASVIE
jgi:hydrogenase expression/formation protein HypC